MGKKIKNISNKKKEKKKRMSLVKESKKRDI
jgi:hypothetical protein